ncbi:hypothetical protein EDB83DRAFT_2319378 [Lactarius deliciosus]|nr:hypothetical protein EDB83DRAFT_2319378 [Lactarius deliciosus]
MTSWTVGSSCDWGTTGIAGAGVTSSWVETEAVVLSSGSRCGGIEQGEMGAFGGVSSDTGRNKGNWKQKSRIRWKRAEGKQGAPLACDGEGKQSSKEREARRGLDDGCLPPYLTLPDPWPRSKSKMENGEKVKGSKKKKKKTKKVMVTALTHAPCKNIDSGKITHGHQKKREKMRSQFHFYPVWHTLVRVCHRWREVIFASPLRLDLQLLCTHGTPVRKNLGCWPHTFPVAIDYGRTRNNLTPADEDSIIAALEQHDRIRFLKFSGTNAVLEKMPTLMQVPFPELRYLEISSRSRNRDTPVLTDGFLGLSAPSLREISFSGISFPALPTLLSSASGLVELHVDIPQTGYILPAAFAACLAVSPKLACLSIGLSSPFRPDRTHLPPETRVVLPSLTSFIFTGESAYLEAIVTRIDTPRLHSIDIAYTNQLDFRVTELSKFTERLAIKPSLFGHAEISIGDVGTCFYLSGEIDLPYIGIRLQSNEGIHEQVIDMARALNQNSTMLSDVVHLEISLNDPESDQQFEDDYMDDVEWLELFRPFTAVKELRVYERLEVYITRALDGQIGAAGTQVLPALDLICVEVDHTIMSP